MRLIQPLQLRPGDKVAAVSLSSGSAGEPNLRWRTDYGVSRLEAMGLRVVPAQNALRGSDFLYRRPEARAEDLMAAFADPEIKGIFSYIGGEESIRLLPFIDYGLIRRNPKWFVGYSDATVTHFMCYKAGLSSLYGPAILSDLAENVALPEYTDRWLSRALFSAEPLGEIPPAESFASGFPDWGDEEATKATPRTFLPNRGHELLQGEGTARGRLVGGCLEVLDWLRGMELFPPAGDFEGAVLFLETSEDMPPPHRFRYILRALGAVGVLGAIRGMIFGKPYGEKYDGEYKAELRLVLAEFDRQDLPVLWNLSFGHCEPKFCLPYGALAEIDCGRAAFRILEGAAAERC
ncbi:MAG: LD-carboxypeptidase [Oscillospiraceae bacterium]|jgi:muramoyltetrapeptide carboxypeptidase LdcA involved in peptidoglycan recycling|nr:LD-carboxypeptidase [Oscillospiraceae bacterium]